MVTGRDASFKREQETTAGKAGDWENAEIYVQDWVSGESDTSIVYIEYPAYTDTNSPARIQSRQVRESNPGTGERAGPTGR